MDLKEYLKNMKKKINESNTIVEVDLGHSIISKKIKCFNIVYIIDKQTGIKDLRLCSITKRFSHTISSIDIPIAVYNYHYMDLLDNENPLDLNTYDIAGVYCLTSIFHIQYLKSKNYRLSTEDIQTYFDGEVKPISTREKTLKTLSFSTLH